MPVNFTKLKNGDWGLRSTDPISAGQRVTVVTKAGDKKECTVGKVLWSGNGVWIATKGGGNGSGRRGGGPVCAECGKGGALVADLEDGLMKHRRCCDIEP